MVAATMLAPASAHAAFGDRTLRSGDTGSDVRVLQSTLTELGFETTVDGHFGRRTRQNVRAYERAEDLRVDGRVSRPQAREMVNRAEAASPDEVDDDEVAPLAETEGE